MFGLKKKRQPEAEVCVVDDSVFLIALDALYRDAMKRFERDELLACARTVVKALGESPADVPIESYYYEDEALTEYFLLMRTLQGLDQDRESEVGHLPAFQQLLEVTSSPSYGRPQRHKLLPVGRDPLTQALADTPVDDWSVDRLVEAANEVALAWDDYSLVGLAAWSRDPVVLAALRESVVLYAEAYVTGVPPPKEFVWAVDPGLVEQANRFIEAFNAICPHKLARIPQPPIPPELARFYYEAYEEADIIGRCARLAIDPGPPERYYHWGLCRDSAGETRVDAFWSEEVWTTRRYRRQRLHRVAIS